MVVEVDVEDIVDIDEVVMDVVSVVVWEVELVCDTTVVLVCIVVVEVVDPPKNEDIDANNALKKLIIALSIPEIPDEDCRSGGCEAAPTMESVVRRKTAAIMNEVLTLYFRKKNLNWHLAFGQSPKTMH